jgi:hypothetical protein
MNEDQFTKLSEQILLLGREIAKLRASVRVLKTYVASQLSPDNLEAGLKQLHLVEQRMLESDPNDQELKKALDIIEASRHWKERGNPPENS